MYRQKPLFCFTASDCIKDFLGFNPETIFGTYNLKPNPVDIFSFDKIFLGKRFCSVDDF